MADKAVLPLKVGDNYSFSKTVSEADVYLFSGITGDFSPVHLNEEYMKRTAYGTRLAQGALTFSFGSTAASLIQQKYESPIPSVSYGYERVRFTKPVFFGDTLTVYYEIIELDEENLKTYAKETITNQKGELVCVATHILKFFPFED